jgi:hypothetical protein
MPSVIWCCHHGMLQQIGESTYLSYLCAFNGTLGYFHCYLLVVNHLQRVVVSFTTLLFIVVIYITVVNVFHSFYLLIYKACLLLVYHITHISYK